MLNFNLSQDLDMYGMLVDTSSDTVTRTKERITAIESILVVCETNYKLLKDDFDKGIVIKDGNSRYKETNALLGLDPIPVGNEVNGFMLECFTNTIAGIREDIRTIKESDDEQN